MDAFARGLAELIILLIAAIIPAASAAAAPAPAPSSGSAELYVADVREAPPELGLSSSIELQPDGTFDWHLTMEQLTLSARGEWDRDGNMIHLSNPDQVGDPGVELAASTRDPAVELSVSLEPATARMASVLEVELEWPDDLFARVPLADGEVSIPAGEERPIAIRLMSLSYSFRSQPFALTPGGDNVLSLRLVPADLGQAFFSSQQMPFDERGMTLDWRGIALRYDRVPARPVGAAQ